MEDFLRLTSKYPPLVIDIESTGGEIWDEMIELAIVDTNCNVLFNNRFKPQVVFFDHISYATHGMTPKQLTKEQSFKKYEQQISRILSNRIILSYNAKSDMAFLYRTYRRYNRILPLFAMACIETMHQKATKLKQPVSLAKACRDFEIMSETGYHTALGGARCAAKLFNKLRTYNLGTKR